MSTTRQDTQSAIERKTAEAELDTLIARFASTHERLVASVRRSLRKRLPTAHEVVYEYADFVVISYSPNGNGYDGVLALRASIDGVSLYFNQAKGLHDPEKLLKGSGKQARWLALEGKSPLTRPTVSRLIDEALAQNRVPFEISGRGQVVVRSTTAQKRRQRST